MAFRSRGPTVSHGPCRLLAMDTEGLVCLPALRTKDGGVRYEDVLYPDELLRDLGGGLYQLATAVEVPADGNMASNYSPMMPVIKVSQLEWTASWASYDRARRRINWDELWARGGSTGNLFKNAILGFVLISSLFTAFAGFRTSGAAGELANQVQDVRGQLIRTQELLVENRAALPTKVPTVAPSRP